MDKNLTRDAGDSISANRFETLTSNVRTQFSLYLKLGRYNKFGDLYFSMVAKFSKVYFLPSFVYSGVFENIFAALQTTVFT